MIRFLISILISLSLITPADARTLSGSLDVRVRSSLSDITSFGNLTDKLDYSWAENFATGERHGSITKIYRGDRSVGTSTPDVIGLVGSITNSIGEVVTMSSVTALYIQSNSDAYLTLSGLATATIPPFGSIALIGSRSIASTSDRLTVTADASAAYRIWIVGK